MSQKERKALVEPENNQLSISSQCRCLGISRSSVYYKARSFSERNLALMKAIDKQYLKTPYYGRRRMCQAIRKRGFQVGEKKISRLMNHMGLRAIAPGPCTSKKAPEYKYIPTCFETLLSIGQIKYGAQTSPIFP